MTELTEAEREALGWQALGGASPSPLLVRAVERIVAARVAEAADAREAEVRAAVSETVAVLLGFDCAEDHIPPHIDVPDDYEAGVHDAAKSVRAALAPADNDGEARNG